MQNRYFSKLLFLLLFLRISSYTCQVNILKTVNTSLFNNYTQHKTIGIGSDIYLVSKFRLSANNNETHFTKIDTNFNIVYSKKLVYTSLKNKDPFLLSLVKGPSNRSIISLRDTLIATNKTISNIAYVNTLTGNVIWSKNIDSLLVSDVKYINNKIILFGNLTNSIASQCYINLDTSGNFINAKRFSLNTPFPNARYYSAAEIDIAKDSGCFFLSNPSSGNYFAKLTKFDKNDNFKWSYEYNASQNSYLSHLKATNDGGAAFHSTGNGYVIKVSQTGNVSWNYFAVDLLNHSIYERPNGDLLVYMSDNFTSQGGHSVLSQNGAVLLKKKNHSCNISNSLQFNVQYANYCIEIATSNSIQPSCYPTALNRNYNALLTRTDFSLSTCNYSTFTSSSSSLTVTKGDSTIIYSNYINPGINSTIVNVVNITNSLTILEDACTSTSIKETESDLAITLFPNPSKNTFIIKQGQFSGKMTIEVYTTSGEKIYANTTTELNTTIDLTNKPAGIYLVKLITETGLTIKKLIKE